MPLHGRNKFLTLIVVNPEFRRNFQIRLSSPPFNIHIHHTAKLTPHLTRPRHKKNGKGRDGGGWGRGYDCTTRQVYFSCIYQVFFKLLALFNVVNRKDFPLTVFDLFFEGGDLTTSTTGESGGGTSSSMDVMRDLSSEVGIVLARAVCSVNNVSFG
jgi:hypothetical protein